MKFVLIKKRTVAKAAIAVTILAGCILGVWFSGAAAVFSNQSVRNHPIYSVETSEQKVALSFDASWGAGRTQSILDVLTTHDVHATFFVAGAWAERHQEVLGTLVQSERIEIGSHSNTHPHMTRLNSRQMELELSTSATILENLTGIRPALFRAPYGEYSDALLAAASAGRLTTIQWDVDGLDWQDLSSYDITNRVLNQANPGSIIRLQNDGRNTAEALGGIIQGLKNRNIQIVPVGELIHTENYTIDSRGRQQKAG